MLISIFKHGRIYCEKYHLSQGEEQNILNKYVLYKNILHNENC